MLHHQQRVIIKMINLKQSLTRMRVNYKIFITLWRTKLSSFEGSAQGMCILSLASALQTISPTLGNLNLILIAPWGFLRARTLRSQGGNLIKFKVDQHAET